MIESPAFGASMPTCCRVSQETNSHVKSSMQDESMRVKLARARKV